MPHKSWIDGFGHGFNKGLEHQGEEPCAEENEEVEEVEEYDAFSQLDDEAFEAELEEERLEMLMDMADEDSAFLRRRRRAGLYARHAFRRGSRRAIKLKNWWDEEDDG